MKMTATPLFRRIRSFLVVLLACAGVLLALPAMAWAANPGEAAYYDERWKECEAKVDWADTGLPEWDGTDGAQPAKGSGTVDDPYQVTTAAELRWCLVNNRSLKLMNDLDLGGKSGKNWAGPSVTQPILVDGNNHTVYNLYRSHSGSDFTYGLIGETTHNDFVMKNLTLSNAKVSTTYGNYGPTLGSLIGRLYAGTVEGCTGKDILVNGANGATSGVGGLFSPAQHNAGVITIRNTHAINVNVYGAYCVSGFIEGPWGSPPTGTLLIEDSAAMDGTAISTQGHSGGFTSCVMVSAGGATYRNCYSNIDVYGNFQTGVFVGVTHQGNHVFENCYSSGKIEGTSVIGGFLGYPEGSNSETFTNCYSTSMVGMSNGGTYMGGFAGKGLNSSGGVTSTFTNCYAAGEVGTLRSAEDGTPLKPDGSPASNQYVTGFIGDGVGNITNCYYDKQTTGMCDYGKIGGKVTDTLTRDLIGANGAGSPVTLPEDVWVTSAGCYPELKAFAESDDPLVRAYSTASTSTLHLYASDDGSDYDTVRRIRYTFPLTSNANSGKADFNVSWANYVGEDPENPLYPNVSPILDGNVPIVTLDKVGTSDSVSSVAPGIGWLQVNAVDKASGQTGMRRLRLVPTTAIAMASFGASGLNNMDVVTSLPDDGLSLDGMKVPESQSLRYDHRDTISFVTTTANSLNSFLLDQSDASKDDKFEKYKITTNGFPENATASINDDGVLVYDLGDGMQHDSLTAVLSRKNADGTFERVPWTPELQKLLEGERTATADDCGTYQISYEWLNQRGDVLKAEGAKTVSIGEPAYVVYHWNDGVHTSSTEGDELYEVYAVDPGLYLVGATVGDAFKAVPEREGYDERYWALSPHTPASAGDAGSTVAARIAAAMPLAAPGDEFTAATQLHAGRNDVYAVWTANTHALTVNDEEGNKIGEVPDAPYEEKLLDLIESTGAADALDEPGDVVGWTTDPDSGSVNIDGDTPMPNAPVTVYPVRNASPRVSKTAENLTHGTGENNVGDEILYRVTAENLKGSSCWQDVVISDDLPVGLDFVAGSARLVMPDGTQKVLPNTVYDAEAHRLSCEAGDLTGGKRAVLEFKAKINAKAVDAGDSEEAAANRDLGNIGAASGKNSDGGELAPEASKPTVPNPDPDADPDDPASSKPGDWTVTPFDPKPTLNKEVVNVTDPEGPVQVGDVLEHTVTVGNDEPGSVWADVVVTDEVPEGVTLVPDSIKVVLPDGTVIPVPDSAYDPGTRVITFGPRSVGGEDNFKLVYETVVDEKAVDDPAIGSKPAAAGEDPHGGKVDKTVDGPALPGAMADDPKVYWADPEGQTAKTAENLTRPGEPTRVGDRIRYEVTAKNVRAGSLWRDVVIFDALPAGLTPDAKTAVLVGADGREVPVDGAFYNPATRLIAVYAGDLAADQGAVLRFEAVVDDDAAGADIGNVGAAYGGVPTPGGEWIQAGPYQVGDPYHPSGNDERIPEGAQATDPVYPHDSDAVGGVLAADGTAAKTLHRLAKTGDGVIALSVLASMAFGAAAVIALARRRLS